MPLLLIVAVGGAFWLAGDATEKTGNAALKIGAAGLVGYLIYKRVK